MKCRTVWKLRWRLIKIRCKEVYMRYIKILILAVLEVIAVIYNDRNGRK